MKRCLGISFAVFCTLLFVAGATLAATVERQQLLIETEQDVVGDVDGTAPVAQKVLQDTVWIADWTFDTGLPCSEAGWVKWDNRILNDGSNYWCVSNEFADSGLVVGNHALLRRHDICWEHDGYGNDWDYAIQLKYQGGAGDGTLAFHFLADSEGGYDFTNVETDSLCLSQARVNYTTAPSKAPADYRTQVFSITGFYAAGNATGIVLKDYGPGTHCALIRLIADGGWSDEDGLYPTYWRSPLIVDDIVVDMPPLNPTPGGFDYTENFTTAAGCGGSASGLNASVSFVNSSNNKPFGEWARVFQHITDNDKCTENTTCAWLNSDPSLPAYYPDMAFGPGGTVVRNWLDDCKSGPFVSLASTPSALGSLIQWRRHGGTTFSKGKIAQNWSVRSKVKVSNTDTSTLGDSVECVRPWAHSSSWSTFSTYNWFTGISNMTSNVNSKATEIQLRFRLSDWQYLTGDGPPATLNTGPGPFDDRIKIGRRIITGPTLAEGIDSRSQSQDAFGAVINAIGMGEHHSPSTSPTRRFDPVPFDEGTELGINCKSPNLITGDSIQIQVTDNRNAGGYSMPKLYGAFVNGVHAGKVPTGAAVGPGGFWTITADSCRGASGVPTNNFYFVDLDDQYMRGGDELVYFWGSKDNQNGFTSDPSGIPGDVSGNPVVTSVADAEAKTGGLLGMSALPTIVWDSTYVAAVEALPDGAADPGPSPLQIAASHQKNCILYYNHFTTRRRSGILQRTSFMWTLDRLGYRGYYDVYDVQGFGNTNNALGGRATEPHCTGYAIIIQDNGRLGADTMEEGAGIPCNEAEKVNQALWYRTWLDNGLTSEIGTATFMLVGENTVQEKGTNPLFGTYMGLSLGSVDNGSGSLNPDVVGVAAMTFWNLCSSTFTGDRFSLQGGCPTIRNYDGLTPTTGTMTHRYVAGTVNSPYAAIVMNKNAGNKWNTVACGFGWFDIRDALPNVDGAGNLLSKIFACVLPINCRRGANSIDTPDELEQVPPRTALFQNVPNPFNPTTTVKFDLARSGQVKLQIFDVAGHLVRTLANQKLASGHQQVTWNGMSDAGTKVSSGVYFYQLVTDDFTATKKMVVLK